MEIANLVERLGAVWQGRVRPRVQAASLALLAVVVLFAAHVGRGGTLPLRALGLGLAFATGLGVAYGSWRQQRRSSDASWVIRTALSPAQPDLAARALRAQALVAQVQGQAATGSADLAALHFRRVLAQADLNAVESAAGDRALRLGLVTAVLGVAGVLLVGVGPQRVLEGLNILVARDGKAPLTMQWLEFPRVTAKPPRYLQQDDRGISLQSTNMLPVGTEVTVRGTALYEGRNLVLTDGSNEVPFATDSKGEQQARFRVTSNAQLAIAARFGDVLIFEPGIMHIAALVDASPSLTLERAPRQMQLSELERLELRWRARDDNGLRQVDLVLQSGEIQERRTLGRYDGEVLEQSGGHVLFATDPFFKRAFLPITLVIEAQDTNPEESRKWGRSEAFSLLPPAVGEPEAKRYKAIADLRSAFVGFLASRKEARLAEPRATPTGADYQAQLAELVSKVRGGLTIAGAAPVPPGLAAFIENQLEQLGRIKGSNEVEERSERVVLAIDAATRGLGRRDAQTVARALGDVAEEAAVGARIARETERRVRGVERLDQAVHALSQGALSLSVLGELGRDLASVAVAGVQRIKRPRQSEDLFHAELAALHLAARLRRPNPSFSALGSSSAESGGGGSSMPSDDASNADEKFDQLADQLGELAQEHAGSVGEVGEALDQARTAAGNELADQEAKSRAEALRRAVAALPEPGEEPGTAEGASALAREHANAMAHALETLNIEDAVESAKNALSAFEDAKRRAEGDNVLSERLERGETEVEKQLEWAKNKLGELERAAAARARESLEKMGEREAELAKRAQNLAQADQAEASLPEDARQRLKQAQQLMEQAARALKAGDGKEALKLQQAAQRLLEEASTGKTSDPPKSEPSSAEQAHGDKGTAHGGDVPGQDQKARAEEFRRRVLKGLAGAKSHELAPAVKRYAEGLLR